MISRTVRTQVALWTFGRQCQPKLRAVAYLSASCMTSRGGRQVLRHCGSTWHCRSISELQPTQCGSVCRRQRSQQWSGSCWTHIRPFCLSVCECQHAASACQASRWTPPPPPPSIDNRRYCQQLLHTTQPASSQHHGCCCCCCCCGFHSLLSTEHTIIIIIRRWTRIMEL